MNVLIALKILRRDKKKITCNINAPFLQQNPPQTIKLEQLKDRQKILEESIKNKREKLRKLKEEKDQLSKLQARNCSFP